MCTIESLRMWYCCGCKLQKAIGTCPVKSRTLASVLLRAWGCPLPVDVVQRHTKCGLTPAHPNEYSEPHRFMTLCVALSGFVVQLQRLWTADRSYIKTSFSYRNTSTCSLWARVTKMWILKISLQLYFLFTICAGQQEEACVDVQQKLQGLAEAVQTLCGSSTPPPAHQGCDCSHAVNWTSVPLTIIASSNLRHSGTLAYDIPSVIPSSAKEVLILADVRSGTSGGPVHYIKIYTQQSGHQYEQYILLRCYPQHAWSFNSDNLWFPLTSGRQVFVELASAHTGETQFALHAIGYRWSPKPCEQGSTQLP